MIHIIGNSHAHYYSEYTKVWESCCDKTHQFFRSYSIGAIIAYNFYEHHLQRVKHLINQISPSKDDYIGLVIGEVDCRWHLPKKAQETGLSIETVVNECVERYFRAIVELRNEGYNIVVLGAHPSTTSGHDDGRDTPVFGECLFRNNIAIQYNSKLKELCLKENIIFISIFVKLVDSNNITKMEYYMDYCHLNSNSHPYMIEEFKNKGIIK